MCLYRAGEKSNYQPPPAQETYNQPNLIIYNYVYNTILGKGVLYYGT